MTQNGHRDTIDRSPHGTVADGPVIETPRLRLRPHRIADFEATLALWQEPEVFRHISGQPALPEDHWHKLLRFAGHWSLLGYGMFLVEDKASGMLMGEVGLADFHRGLGPDFDGAHEAAWVLGPWAHGRGIGQEAVRAVFDWAAAALNPERIVCIINPMNEASINLARKLDFAAMRTASYRDRPVILFERALPKTTQAG